MATFRDAWSQAWIDVPDADSLQVRQWTQNAYKRLCHVRPWSWRRKQSAFQILDAVTLASVGVIQGSSTVTSVGLFTAAMVGRQFRVGSYPVYTILTRPDANTITLDRPYELVTNAAAAGQVLSAVVTAPADLDSLDIVVDLVNQVRIGHWYTQDQLSLLDPTRTNAYSGPVRGLFSFQLSTLPATAGRLQWEAWPYGLSAATLPYFYWTAPADLTDDTALPGALLHRPDVLAVGAKAEAALYPGNLATKNPYYNLDLARIRGDDFARLLTQLSNRDDDQYQQDIDNTPWYRYPLANLAPTADWLRRSDASVWDADYVY